MMEVIIREYFYFQAFEDIFQATFEEWYKRQINSARIFKLKFSPLFKCHDFGHISSEYPNQKIVSLVEVDVNEDVEKNYSDEDESEGEVLYDDQGESLIVWRSLYVAHVEDDQWLRNINFHTRCTSHRRKWREVRSPT